MISLVCTTKYCVYGKIRGQKVGLVGWFSAEVAGVDF